MPEESSVAFKVTENERIIQLELKGEEIGFLQDVITWASYYKKDLIEEFSKDKTTIGRQLHSGHVKDLKNLEEFGKAVAGSR